MNKDQIIKHKEVMLWFIDNPDKGVYERSAKKLHESFMFWTYVSEPNWYTDKIYVQNDKYVEYRKALSDGKIVEFCTIANHYSNVISLTVFNELIKYDKYSFRIKPDEPKFKVGDWVYNKQYDSVYQIEDIDYKEPYCEPWKPTENEWICYLVWTDGVEQQYEVKKYKDRHISTKGLYPLEFIQTLKDK